MQVPASERSEGERERKWREREEGREFKRDECAYRLRSEISVVAESVRSDVRFLSSVWDKVVVAAEWWWMDSASDERCDREA